jgi:hypothetical protein
MYTDKITKVYAIAIKMRHITNSISVHVNLEEDEEEEEEADEKEGGGRL